MIDLGSEPTPIEVRTVRETMTAQIEEIARLKRELAAAHRAEAAGGIVIGEVNNARARKGLRGLVPASGYAPDFGHPVPALKPARRKR